MPSKPKPRVVYLIENKDHPTRFLYSIVCRTKRDAEHAVKTFSKSGRIRKFVEVRDE